MIVAVDTGGTKTLLALFTKEGEVLKTFKFATPSNQDFYVNELVSHIKTLVGEETIDCISAALPDVTEGDVVERFANLPWKNFNAKQELMAHFKDIPIIVGNDANLGGLGEVHSLAKLPHRALYVTISTGIGTGFLHSGHISHTLMATEGGHIMLEYDGVLREWEKFASGKAIFETYGMFGKDITSKKTWTQIADRISRGFLALIPILKPDVIIIGGSMGTHFEKYRIPLEELLDEHLPFVARRPAIVAAKRPEEAVIYGCYYNAIR